MSHQLKNAKEQKIICFPQLTPTQLLSSVSLSESRQLAPLRLFIMCHHVYCAEHCIPALGGQTCLSLFFLYTEIKMGFQDFL